MKLMLISFGTYSTSSWTHSKSFDLYTLLSMDHVTLQYHTKSKWITYIVEISMSWLFNGEDKFKCKYNSKVLYIFD